jgi:hypothetical protein
MACIRSHASAFDHKFIELIAIIILSQVQGQVAPLSNQTVMRALRHF